MTAALAAGPAPQPPPLAVLAVVAPAADADAGPTAPLSPTRAAARRARKRWKSAFRHVLHPRTSRQKVVCAVVWTTVAVAGLAFAVFVLPRLMQKVGSGWSGAVGRRDGPSARLPTLYSFSSPSRAGHRPPHDHPPPLAPPPRHRGHLLRHGPAPHGVHPVAVDDLDAHLCRRGRLRFRTRHPRHDDHHGIVLRHRARHPPARPRGQRLWGVRLVSRIPLRGQRSQTLESRPPRPPLPRAVRGAELVCGAVAGRHLLALHRGVDRWARPRQRDARLCRPRHRVPRRPAQGQGGADAGAHCGRGGAVCGWAEWWAWARRPRARDKLSPPPPLQPPSSLPSCPSGTAGARSLVCGSKRKRRECRRRSWRREGTVARAARGAAPQNPSRSTAGCSPPPRRQRPSAAARDSRAARRLQARPPLPPPPHPPFLSSLFTTAPPPPAAVAAC